MNDTFARRVFLIAGLYGVLVLVPQFFLEGKIGRDYPPAITHPEYFYGFVGVALAWQVLFLILARDPLRYRLMIIPAILEKLAFGLAVIVLFAQQRVQATLLFAAGVDFLLAVLFVVAWRRLGTLEHADRAARGN